MWPAVHMPIPWLPKWWSWIWSRDEHIPKVIGAIHKFKVTREEIWFLPEVLIHSHSNLPFNTGAISHLQPQWINQGKLGTDFWKEDNDTCRKTYSLGSHHNIQCIKELLQRKVLENTELLMKNKNSSVIFYLYATNTRNVLFNISNNVLHKQRQMDTNMLIMVHKTLLKSSKMAW